MRRRERLDPMESLNAFIEAAVSTPWIYAVIALAVLIDAFFPPVPSESVVIAASAAAVSVGLPNIGLVIVCAALAALGAIAGDNITFAIGRIVGIDRFAWMRRRRMRAALDATRRGMARRPAVIVMTARYVPVGRVAVNLVAGATGFSRARFFGLSVIAGTTWAAYSVAIGLLAGRWLHGNPLLGMVVGICAGAATGVIIDVVMRLVARRRDAVSSSEEASRPARVALPERSEVE